MSLAGKTILITRAAAQVGKIIHLIEQQSGIPIIFPTIEIVQPDSWEMVDKAIDGLYMYDGMVFTSTNGVEFFFQRLIEKNIFFSDLKKKMIFVVGNKTKQTVESYGLSVTTIPEKFTAQELANKLQQEDLNGKYFLFPRGNLAKDVLPATLKLVGAAIDEIIIYQTKQPKPENINVVRKLITNSKIDVVIFTSPSTVKNFFNIIPKNVFSSEIKIAVIGPTTAKAIEELGLDIDIQPEQSTIEALVEAIVKYFQL